MKAKTAAVPLAVLGVIMVLATSVIPWPFHAGSLAAGVVVFVISAGLAGDGDD